MFVQRTLDFLYYNRKYNSPDWYKAHKEDYTRYVLEPMKELVNALAPTMLNIDRDFVVEAKVDRCISRLFRDMRYATDGFRYRDKIWCVFAHDKRTADSMPGYFFEVSPYSFDYGCGYFQADPMTIKTFRRMIKNDSPEFKAAKQCYEKQNIFSTYGDISPTYVPDPELSDIANDWMSRKNAGLIAESKDINLLFGKDLPEYLADAFIKIKDWYYFLKSIEDMKFARTN